MKILIAGCGEVGEALARELAGEGHDLTLMDSDRQVLNAGMERIDVLAVQGNCASMDALRRAGIKKADLLIACTGSDELNLLCCMTAHGMNPKLHTIARIRDPEYLEQVYSMRDAFGISLTFNPDLQAAIEIERLIKYPGFLKREAFLGGKVEIVELRVDEKSKLKDVPMKSLGTVIKCQVLVCAVLREGKAVIPDGRMVLREGDRIFVTGTSDDLSLLLKNLGIVTKKIRRVMIAGGGSVCYYLTERLGGRMDVTIIERDRARCHELADSFPKATVICGDAGDHSLLDDEELGKTDALVSLTASDSTNAVLSLYGSSLHIPQIVTQLNQLGESSIFNDLPLGSVVSPAKTSCGTVVGYVRSIQRKSGSAITVHSIADGQVDAIEFPVVADTLFAGVPLKRVRFKKDVRLVCIARGDEIIIPNGESVFEPGDTVVVLVNGDEIVLDLNDIFA